MDIYKTVLKMGIFWDMLCLNGVSCVEVDQVIHLSMGWDAKDDTLTSLVKIPPIHDSDNNNDNNDSKIRKTKTNKSRQHTSTNGDRNKEETKQTITNVTNNGKEEVPSQITGKRLVTESAWPEVNENNNFVVLEQLKGDKIEFNFLSEFEKHRNWKMTLPRHGYDGARSKWKGKLIGRHRRDEVPEDPDNWVDCVHNGESIRMRKEFMNGRDENEENDDEKPVKAKSEGRAMTHVIVMVEEGSEARMACRRCDKGEKRPQESATPNLDGKESLLWYKLSRRKGQGHFKIQEVSLEMHDDESRDRVRVTPDHTLIIGTTRSHDAGSYFCRTPGEEDDVTKKTVPLEDMARLIKDPYIRFFYHLDVLKPSQDQAVLVSSDGSDRSLPRPSPPKSMPGVNLRVFHNWQAWTPCSVCDNPGGTRRRVGQCYVRKMSYGRSASPLLLDSVLSSYFLGVPCRSSLLRGHDKLRHLVTKPDEVIQEECNVTCALHHARLVFSAFGFLGSSFFKGHHSVKQKRFRETEGDHVTLKCQHTSVDKAVAWVNGSIVLLPTRLNVSSGGRVWVDEHNSLHMNPVLPWDSSSYVCLIQGQVKGFVRLEVKAKPPECKVCRYAVYIVLTFPVNFVIYCVIIYAKHKERQRVLNYNLLDEYSSSTSNAQNSSGSTTTSSGDVDTSST